MTRARSILVGSLVLMCAVGVGAQDPPAQPARQGKSTILEKIIVKVNGEILTLSELTQLQVEKLQSQNKQVNSVRDISTNPGLMTALNEITPDILIQAIDELLLVQHGREIGIKFGDEQFKMAIDNVKKQNRITDQQLADELKRSGMTMDQLRQNFERQWLMQGVQQREIMKNTNLTEQEARQYYKSHPDQFMKPPSVTLREILVAIPVETVGGQQTVNVAKEEEAKAKVEGLRERALKGEDFVKLVGEASESGTKANGGTIGPVLTEELNPAIAAVLEKLKPGEISEPLRTRNGYQLLKLETRTPAEVEAFDKVRSEIAQRLYEARLDVEQEKFLDKLRVQAVIEWKDDTYKKMFEQGQAARAKKAKTE